jgi:hypothetical protein
MTRLEVVNAVTPIAWRDDYNIQIHPDTARTALDGVSSGEPLRVTNPHNELDLELFGRADVREAGELDPGELGMGADLRKGLGLPTGSEADIDPIDSPTKSPLQATFDRLLDYRPVVCRVKKATFPDTGHPVCRLPDATMDLLGVREGDKVIVETSSERVPAKALPHRSFNEENKRRQHDSAPDLFPECSEVATRNVGREFEIEDKLSPIQMNIELREQLGITGKANGGSCQPVRVERHSTNFLLRSLNESLIPVLAGLLGFVVVFDGILSNVHLMLIFVAALLLILLSLFTKARKVIH